MPKYPSVFRNLYYGPYQQHDRRYDLFKCTKDSLDYVQSLEVFQRLAVHQGCVNTVSWSESGDVLLSGSDDQHLCITNASTFKTLVNLETAHRANIFSAKFLPNCENRKIVSCSGDGLIIYTDLDRPEVRARNSFNCHHGTTYKVVTIPNEPSSFMSCGEDGTVRWFDLRMKNSCSVENCREDVLLSYSKSVTALAVDQVYPYQFAIGCCDSSVGIYDRRMLGTKATDNYNDRSYEGLVSKFSVPAFDGKSYRITSLTYSADCREVLVSYSSENLFLFDIKSFHNGSEPKLRAVFGTPGSSSADSLPSYEKKSTLAPPMKRLRLRGDWSDTGPHARPNVERELRDDGQMRLSFHAHLMQHVSTVLTRMLNEQPEQASQALAGRLIGMSNATPRTPLDPPPSTPSPDSFDNVGNHEPDGYHSQTEGNDNDNNNDVAGSSSQADATDQAESSNGHAAPRLNLPAFPVTLHVDLPSLDSSDMDESDDRDAMFSSLLNSPDSLDFRLELPLRAASCQRESPSDAAATANTSDSGVGNGSPSLETPNGKNAIRTTPVSMDLVTSGSESEPDAGVASTEASGERHAGHPLLDDTQRGSVNNSGECSSSAVVPETVSDGEAAASDDADDEREERLTGGTRGVFAERRRRSLKTNRAHQFHSLAAKESPENEQERTVEDLEEAFIRGLPQPVLRQKYTGHRNARTMIKEANFWGSDYVMSGSDCGHVFIWNRHTAELVMILEADRRVVNCVQPHPFDPVLATSGIDYDVKLWGPVGEHPNFDAARAAELTSRNQVMLEETRDTITVPASFMIRMLASFNHLRQSSPIARWRQSRQANRPRED